MNALAVNMPWLTTLLLVWARVAGMTLVAPVLAHGTVPVRLRVGLAAVMALAATAAPVHPAAIGPGTLALGLAICGEALIGLTIGYVVRLIFVGVELGAFHISQQMGLSLGQVFDPSLADASGEEAAGDPIRRGLVLTATVVFLALGGHRSVIAAVMGSFHTLPVAGSLGPAGCLQTAVLVLGVSFTLALRTASAVLVALLVTSAALGILQRSVPQFNVFTVGLGVRAIVTLAVLAASLMLLTPLVAKAMDIVMAQVQLLVG